MTTRFDSATTSPLPAAAFTPDRSLHSRWMHQAFWAEVYRAVLEDEPKREARLEKQRERRAEIKAGISVPRRYSRRAVSA